MNNIIEEYEKLKEDYVKLENSYNEALCTIEEQRRTINRLTPIVREHYKLIDDFKNMLVERISEVFLYGSKGYDEYE